MNKDRYNLKKRYFIGVVILLLATTFLPFGLSDFILPELGGGVVHQDPQMSENIWLPPPTENVGELWYSDDYGGENWGCQGNGIVGNGNIAATTFNNPLGKGNLIIYDYYGNRIWDSGQWPFSEGGLSAWAFTSSPMIDINDRVIACDNQKIIMVDASNRDNIQVEWNASIPLGAAPVSPIIVENRAIILPTAGGPLLLFDVETGEELANLTLGQNTTIDPYYGIQQMSWTNFLTVWLDYLSIFNSICPYRYNSTSELIEWNSTVPYGIMGFGNPLFIDGDIAYSVSGNIVTAWEKNELWNWTYLTHNNIDPGEIITGEGFFSTINSACVDGNRVYLVTEYRKPGTRPVFNNTIGRLYAVNVSPDAENESDRLVEDWNFTYYGRSQASPTLINDTLYFDGFNNTLLPDNRDPRIFAVYTNGTEKWKKFYDNITLFTFTTDPRGGFWYEDCDQLFRFIDTGGNKLVRFSEENGSIIEEIDMKTLLNYSGQFDFLPVLPSSDMTICGTEANPIMFISANHPRFWPGKWVLAVNLSDNNSVIWKVPIESPLNRNFAHGDYTILTENNVSRVLFPTNVGGVYGVGTYPDDWVENPSYELWDKPNDGDSYNDSVNVSFSIKSCLPHDLATVEVALISADNPVLHTKIETMEYTVNTSGTEGDITVTLPNWFLDGEYKLGVYLFNSSGKFKSEHLNISDFLKFDRGLYANETYIFGPFELHPSNSKPNPPHQPTGATEVNNSGMYSYTSNTTDNDSVYLYYKWKWDTIFGPVYSLWNIFNPYQSGENCTQDIGWIGTGSRDISVRAKDHWLSIDPTDWSEPLTVNVSQSDNGNGGSWSNPLLNSFSANVVAVNEQTSSTGFNSEVYIEQGSKRDFSWFWDFGDGSNSSDEEVSHNYSQVGNYTVNLTITYQGDEYNVSTVIEVLPLKARYTTSSDGSQPDVNIIFNDTSQGLYDITNYTWDLGDGNVSYEQNVSHSFPSEGVYNVTLTVMDQNENINTHYQIIHVETTAPTIIYVDETPHTVGFGSDVNIYADFYDNESQIDSVSVNITYPDDSSGNFSMSKNLSCPYDFEYVFNDTWQVGLYKYSIWVYDNAGNSNVTGLFNFSVSANATIKVQTLKNTYGSNEIINITDPPPDDPPSESSLIGYELLDDDKVLHIWNKYDSYYFNTSSGIQLTNYYNEYWSHNVLMLGYYNNDEWNLIYRTDELSGFNKNIEFDNETFVNATLWKDLTYNGYDFRLAIRYHLGIDDNDLTVIPYIKNLGQAIPYVLGFAWEINDIQIDMTPENDYIEINDTFFYLNETIDVIYTSLSDAQFRIKENMGNNRYKDLYLRWNISRHYIVQIKSRDGQYNAPVILAIRVGTLNESQEKQTKLFWHDASGLEITVYSTKDSYLRKHYPNSNYGYLDYMWIDPKFTQTNRMLVQMDMPSELDDAYISSAILKIRYYSYSGINPRYREHECWRIEESWDENGVNWGNQPDWDTLEDTITLGVAYGYKSWDGVKDNVQDFIEGDLDNYGWLLGDENEGTALSYAAKYYSREKSGTIYDPKLVIEYLAPPESQTNQVTNVDESGVRMNGEVIDDGGGDCQYSFSYDVWINGKSVSSSTTWTGNVATDESFYTYLFTLDEGRHGSYYARLRHSVYPSVVRSGSSTGFLTKPDTLTGFTANAYEEQVNLTWSNGAGGDGAYIEWFTSPDGSWNPGDHTKVDADGYVAGEGFIHENRTPGTSYYYKAWAYADDAGWRSSGNSTAPFGDAPKTAEATTGVTTSVDAINPYTQTSSPLTVTASGYPDLDNVSLCYRYSADNSSWGEGENWWDSSWTERDPVYLSVSSGDTEENYTVLLNIMYDSDMQNDFDDLRFVRYSDNTTELDYWIESKSDGNWALVWVEIADNITTTNQTLAWMYYGNSGVSTTSNGTNTFILFDDFSTDTDSLWTEVLDGQTFYHTRSIGQTLTAARLRWKAKCYDENSRNWAGHQDQGLTDTAGTGTYTGNYIRLISYYNSDSSASETQPSFKFYTKDGTTAYSDGTKTRAITEGNTYIWEQKFNSNHGKIDVWTTAGNNVYSKTYTQNLPSSVGYHFLDHMVYYADGGCTQQELKWYSGSPNYLRSYCRGSHYGCDSHVEYHYYWIFISKYATSEPTYSIGSEQTNGWTEWDDNSNPDTSSPWSWEFDFPDGKGYYEFYSIGKKSGLDDEFVPDNADTSCCYMTQSKIKNTGSTDIKGYLLMQVQYFNETLQQWVVADDTVNETMMRVINAGEQLGLDTIFNGLVNTNDLSEFGNGTYRIYAAFRDPEGNILVTDDQIQLVATYEFTVTFE